MRRITAILFLILFGFSNVGFNMEVHFCDGNLTDFSFLGNTECICETDHHEDHCNENSCHEVKPCHEEKNDHLVEVHVDCCSTQEIIVENTESFKTHSVEFVLAIILASDYSIFQLAESEYEMISPVPSVEPVFLDRDIPILVQSFLI